MVTQQRPYDHLLNEQQQKAVYSPHNRLLIAAGAGTGKTRAITHRIGWLINHQNIPPEHVVAVTFTNRAADEMRERVQTLTDRDDIHKTRISTFHSLCVRILRQHIHHLGLDPAFSIYDRSDSARTLKQILGPNPEHNPSETLKTIGLMKNRLQTPEQTPEPYRTIWNRYQTALHNADALDFDDLVNTAVKLLTQIPAARRYWTNKYRHLLIDEFQDTDPAQYQLVKTFLTGINTFCAVGDSNQSIYSFRGADPKNMKKLLQEHPTMRVIRLNRNYRSTNHILKTANHLIRHNPDQVGTDLYSQHGTGTPVTIHQTRTDQNETTWVTKQILNHLNSGTKPEHIAILYRLNIQSRPYETELNHHNIPYRVLGGPRFYEQPEIRDVLNYLRLIINPGDNIACLRALNRPRRGIGPATIAAVTQHAEQNHLSIWETCQNVTDITRIPNRGSNSIQQFVDHINHLTDTAHKHGTHQTTQQILNEPINYTHWVTTGKAHPGTKPTEDRLQNLEELGNATKEHDHKNMALTGGERTRRFVEDTALNSGDTPNHKTGKITLSTLHTAKGLEFPRVYILGAETQLIPHKHRTVRNQAEERRLLYVGITRAETELTITHTQKRTLYGETYYPHPSPFLTELGTGPHLNRKTTQNGVNGRTKEQQLPTGETVTEGDTVHHPQHGEGTVIRVNPSGVTITVEFAGGKTQNLLTGFAPLTKTKPGR